MSCIAPDEIQEGDLLAFLESEAAASVSEHIGRCSYCQAELVALQSVDRLMREALDRRDCPDVEQMLLYQKGLLSRSEAITIQRHVAMCLLCWSDLGQLVHTSQYGPAGSRPTDRLNDGRRWLQATPVPTDAPRLPALRGSVRRPVVYEVGDFQMTIVKEGPLSSESRYQIAGRLTRQSGPFLPIAGTVHLTNNDEPIAEESMDEFGHFVLDDLAPGRYRLQIRLPAELINVDELDVP